MDIRPIRNKEDHLAALKEIERLWNAASGTPEADRMEVLAILVEDYESKHFPVSGMAPSQVLRYAIEEMGRTQTELADILGSRSRASEVLSGKRSLTTDGVYRVAKAWHIPAELLIRPQAAEAA